MTIVTQLYTDNLAANNQVAYFTQPDPLAPQTKARSVDINTLANAVLTAFQKIPVSDQVWTGTHDYSGGSLRVKMPTLAAEAASKGYVDARIVANGQLPPLPGIGTYILYSVGGAFTPKAAGPMNDATSLAQTLSLHLSI